MVASEPQLRRRGYFLSHTETDPDIGETESPEGVTFRVRLSRPMSKRHGSGSAGRASSASRPHRRGSPPKAVHFHTGGHGPVK